MPLEGLGQLFWQSLSELQLLTHTLGASASFLGASGGAVIVAEAVGAATGPSSDVFAQACATRESAMAQKAVETEKPRTLEERMGVLLA
jgi:hypothetical protein